MKNKILDDFLRVDHAGERAAQNIYKGQIVALKNHKDVNTLIEMMEQEQEHLDKFDELLNQYKVRPSLLDPIWKTAGFVLGRISGSFGMKTAMACTIAVEEVIGNHYAEQIKKLEIEGKEKQLIKILKKFRDDELEHHDTAIDFEGKNAIGFKALKFIIQSGCKTAIKIAEKV
tara:strand:- start:629 stop:1147 length:519 start_codon:yes stop_codon:yes gene_type:complete